MLLESRYVILLFKVVALNQKCNCVPQRAGNVWRPFGVFQMIEGIEWVEVISLKCLEKYSTQNSKSTPC